MVHSFRITFAQIVSGFFVSEVSNRCGSFLFYFLLTWFSRGFVGLDWLSDVCCSWSIFVLYCLCCNRLIGVSFHLLEWLAHLVMWISSRIHLGESLHDELLLLHVSPMLLIILFLEHECPILSDDGFGLFLLFCVILEDFILFIDFFFCYISEIIWKYALDRSWWPICFSESVRAAGLWGSTGGAADNQLPRSCQLILLEHVIWILSKLILKNQEISKGKIDFDNLLEYLSGPSWKSLPC